MTETAFGRLLYTDCRPGQGRGGGGGGFQIQAQSPNVDYQQSSAAVGWLLYEAQDAWIADRRPVAQFPPGFAHSNADGYATAQSLYVGKEANGGRMGNHLADCLLTRDPGLYGSVRPALLWRSSLWRTEPWDSIECPPFDGILKPEPLMTLEKVIEWVREQRERVPVLSTLLSVLENADGQRVVIVSADADEAMRWIAAATLLLPQRQALQISFKVFSAAPLRARQRLVAAPPDLNPDLRPGTDRGVFVLDAGTCTSDEATVTPYAAFLTDKLTDGDDPYDIVDAIALADELCGGAWPQDIGALHAAWVLTVPDAPVPDLAPLFRWIQTAGAAQLLEHGSALAERLVSDGASVDVLQWVDSKVAAGELEFDHDAVRLKLLEAEIAGVIDGTAAPGEVLRPMAISEQASRDAESALTSALLRHPKGTIKAPENTTEFDRLLRLAHRHGISLMPPSPVLREHVEEFARTWIAGTARHDPSRWALSEVVLSRVQDELQELYAKDQSRPTRDKVRLFLPYLSGVNDPTNPLYWPLQADLIKRMTDAPGQVRKVRGLLEETKGLRERGEDADAAERQLQQALIDWGALNEELAIVLLTELSSTVMPQIESFATGWLAKQAEHPDEKVLQILRNLGSGGRGLPTALAETIASDQDVEDFLERVKRDVASQRATSFQAVERLCAADPVVLEIRMPEILQALYPNSDLTGTVYALLPKDKKGHGPAKKLETLLVQGFGDMQTPQEQAEFAIWCAQIYGHRDLKGDKISRMGVVLRELQEAVIRGRGEKAAEKWRSEVSRRLDDAYQAHWEKAVPPTSIRTIRR
jgi:GTPase-associated protein 1, N-terminal domain type 2/GTPase-associated protein 1, middle domain